MLLAATRETLAAPPLALEALGSGLVMWARSRHTGYGRRPSWTICPCNTCRRTGAISHAALVYTEHPQTVNIPRMFRMRASRPHERHALQIHKFGGFHYTWRKSGKPLPAHLPGGPPALMRAAIGPSGRRAGAGAVSPTAGERSGCEIPGRRSPPVAGRISRSSGRVPPRERMPG